MDINICTNLHQHQIDSKRKLFLLTSTIVFLVLTISMSGIYDSPLQLAFAQKNNVISENLWSENLNVTSGDPIPGQKLIVFPNGSMPESDINTLADSIEDTGFELVDVFPEAGVLVANVSDKEAAQLSDSIEIEDPSDIQPGLGPKLENNTIVTIDSQTLPTGVDRIDAERSWSSQPGTTVNATIGILDTGIDLDNPDLNVVENVSFVKWSPTGNDVHGHGTHVAGIVAAKDDGNGVVGVAPGAKLIAIKVLNDFGFGSTQNILDGLTYVLNNAEKFDVINLSLGSKGKSHAYDQIINKIVDAGVNVVVSAGNNNLSAVNHRPGGIERATTVSASYDSDGKCGALGPSYERQGKTIKDDSFAPYSNHGWLVDIMAPGTAINSTQPNGGFAVFSGTSMAAPHVAGTMAVLKSQNPNASPEQIEDLLFELAEYPPNACEKQSKNGAGYISDRREDNDSDEEAHLYLGKLQ